MTIPGYGAFSNSLSDRAARPGFPPLQCAQIVELACLEPIAKGLHITHWSSEDLARQAVADGVVVSISPRTVRLILDRVDLQPHRTRYWRTTRLDPRFKARAEKVLWCYPGFLTRGMESGCLLCHRLIYHNHLRHQGKAAR
jgi:hypothetical protein